MSNDKIENEALPEDASVARLLKGVGKRSEIPAGTRHDAETNFRAELKRARERRRSRTSLGFALAASMVLAIFTAFWMVPGEMPQPIVRVEAVSGEGYWISGGVRRELVAGIKLAEGDSIETSVAPVRLSLLDNPIDIRVGQNAEVELVSSGEIHLLSGEIYIDTIAANEKPFVISTAQGRIQHTGTQYLVSQGSTRLMIAVREGSVHFEGLAARVSARAGSPASLLTVTRAGSVMESEVSPVDPIWNWTLLVSPGQNTNGQSLLSALEWAARETGYELDASSEVKQAAEAEVIKGELNGLKPLVQVRELVALTDRFLVVINPAGQIQLSLAEGYN